MYVYSFTGILELDNSDDCVELTRERRRTCNEEALQLSFSSGRYPEYLGIEGPQDRNNPQTCNPLDFLFLLWPKSLCGLIKPIVMVGVSQIGWILIGMSY